VTEFERTLLDMDLFFRENFIDYAIIGGIAVIIYGSQRTTKDIDTTILCRLKEKCI